MPDYLKKIAGDLRAAMSRQRKLQKSLGYGQPRISEILNNHPRARRIPRQRLKAILEDIAMQLRDPEFTALYRPADAFNDQLDCRKVKLATEITSQFECALTKAVGSPITSATVQSIPTSVLSQAAMACEQLLNRFADIRVGSDFKAISTTLLAATKITERAYNARVGSYHLFSRTHDTLVHSRCYVDAPRALRLHTDRSLLAMSRILVTHNTDLSLRRAFFARNGDRDKIEAADGNERSAALKLLEDARRIPIEHAGKEEYYLLRSYVTLAAGLDGFSDNTFIELLKRTEQEIHDERLQLSLHQKAHVLEAMSDGCVLRYQKREVAEDAKFSKLAVWYYDLARGVSDQATEVFGVHGEFRVRLLRLVATLCDAGVTDHLPTTSGMPVSAHLINAKRVTRNFAREIGNDRLFAQMS